MFPERFNNKTNGVTPRRWLLLANPPLASAITKAIGDRWIVDLNELRRLKPLAADSSFQESFLQRRARSKGEVRRLAQAVSAGKSSIRTPSLTARSSASTNTSGNCSTRCVWWCSTIGCAQIPSWICRRGRFFLLEKQRPLITSPRSLSSSSTISARSIDADPAVRGRIKVLFLPEYCVSLAERLIPASDVSNQISTAGYEASGTSNMKFMMNGALTIGTRDGATIEMVQEAGEENFFLFGLTAEQVANARAGTIRAGIMRTNRKRNRPWI